MFSLVSDEILGEVLTWVPPLDLISNVNQVCVRFHTTLEHDGFWCNLAEDLKVSLSREEVNVRNDDDGGNNSGDNNDTTTTIIIADEADDKSDDEDDDANCSYWPSTSDDELTKHQYQRLCLFVASYKKRHDQENEKTIPKCLEVGNVLVSKEEASRIRTLTRGYLRTCFASSTDNRNELIENVLIEGRHNTRDLSNSWNSVLEMNPIVERVREIRGDCTWWSSRATNTQHEAEECLAFCTEYNTSLMIEVAIKPLRDPFLRSPVYTWQYTTIRAYQLDTDKIFRGSHNMISNSNNSHRAHLRRYLINTRNQYHPDDAKYPCVMQGKADGNGGPWNHGDWSSDNDMIQNLLDDEEPIYESKQLVGPKNDGWIRYKLPPGGVVGNLLTITLHGKDNRQYQATGYYACIERLFIRGIPLYETEQDQKFSFTREEGD